MWSGEAFVTTLFVLKSLFQVLRVVLFRASPSTLMLLTSNCITQLLRLVCSICIVHTYIYNSQSVSDTILNQCHSKYDVYNFSRPNKPCAPAWKHTFDMMRIQRIEWYLRPNVEHNHILNNLTDSRAHQLLSEEEKNKIIYINWRVTYARKNHIIHIYRVNKLGILKSLLNCWINNIGFP